MGGRFHLKASFRPFYQCIGGHDQREKRGGLQNFPEPLAPGAQSAPTLRPVPSLDGPVNVVSFVHPLVVEAAVCCCQPEIGLTIEIWS